MDSHSLHEEAVEAGACAGSPWPEHPVGNVVFLLDARDSYELRLLREWIERTRKAPDSNAPQDFTLPKNRAADEFAAIAELDRDSWLQPLRIAWLPRDYDEDSGLLRDLFFARTENPGIIHRKFIAWRTPERMRFIAAQGTTLGELETRYRELHGDADVANPLPNFIRHRALITLERAERVVRGARYKVPRLLPADVFANAEFRRTLKHLAQRRDQDIASVTRQAERYLHEMAARQTPFTLDLMMAVSRAAVRSSHEPDIDVDEEQLKQVATLLGSRPVVFLISHKSMLDTASLSIALFEANLPLPLTFGGINLNTPGFGALARRAGIIFLRRSFQDNEIYKATFRRYIDYLIDKRFSLLWALEGTRSRTGKLLPPRFGLFNYVVESILRTRLFDVAFVPVSVAYEQITEVEDYATEQRGQAKKPEGATWILRFLRPSKARRGRIFLRFGRELALTDLAPESRLRGDVSEFEKHALVQNLALQVAYRMNAATPITATAVVTLILLAAGNRALSLKEIRYLARSGLSLIRRRELEVVGRVDFDQPASIEAALAQLKTTGIISYFDEGKERLYGITEDQHLEAAYYRNTAIHYFILDALVEVALLRAADWPADEREQALFDIAEALREIFIFEFYFPRRRNYGDEVGAVLEDRFEDWRGVLGEGPDAVRAMLRESRPLLGHAVLRSFADAYLVVARALVERRGAAVDDRAAFVADCLKLGRHMRLQGKLLSPESVSKSLFETALKLAAHRKLLISGAESVAGRGALYDQLREVRRALDTILELTLETAGD